MSYGLDFTEVRYETDHAGNRLKATIPFSMFSALTEFWIAARRMQTAKLEATTRPGQYKGSLQSAVTPTPDRLPEPPPHSKLNGSAYPSDRKWNALLASLPEPDVPAEPIASPSPTPAAAPVESPAAEMVVEPSPQTKPRRPRVFYREFVAAPPAEVMQRIEGGTYFIRAWREHRGLTLTDAADLFGRDKTTIIWHESGKTAPSPMTLEKFAQIYDCPLDQMTPRPGSSTALPGAQEVEAVAEPKARTISEPRSPADTDYPEGVLTHLMAGKSPLLAWRLYRNMSVKALADAYGTTGSNVKSMEQNAWLRRSTIDKLCPIFHCKPEQLLRPAGMPSERDAVQEAATVVAAASKVSKVNGTKKAAVNDPAPSAMEAAFMQAGSLDSRKDNERTRTRNQRLARMQAELARL